LPAKPLQDIIEPMPRSLAAAKLGVTPRRIRAFLHEQKSIQLDTADRWCLALDTHLGEVYD
jgi:plasmid maintenance system antidote protein VapI